MQPDGKIVVSGWEAVAVSGSDFNVLVARLNVDGTLDGGFGNGGFKTGAVPRGTRFEGTGVALQSSGSIIVVGHDNPLSGNADPHPFLMRFYGDNAPLSAAAEADANSARQVTPPSMPRCSSG